MSYEAPKNVSWLGFLVIAVMALIAVWPIHDAAYESSRASDWFFVSDSRIAWESTSDITLPRGGSLRPLGQLGYLLEFVVGTQKQSVVRRISLVFHVAAACFMAWGIAAAFRSRRLGSLTGFLFAIHPVVVPQVYFAEGRHLQVLAIFFGLTLAAWSRWREVGSKAGKWVGYVGAFAAPLAHPLGMCVAPLVAFSTPSKSSDSQVEGQPTSRYAALGLWVAGALGVVSVLLGLGADAIAPHVPADVSLAERFGAVGRSFLHLFVHTGPTIHERISDCGSTWDFVGVGVLVALGLASLVFARKASRRHFAVSATWVAVSCLAPLASWTGFADIRPEEAAWMALPGVALFIWAVMDQVGARISPYLMGVLFFPLMWIAVDRARAFVPLHVAIAVSARQFPNNALAQLDLAEHLGADSERQADAERHLELALAHARTVETEFEVRYSLARFAYSRDHKELLREHVARLEALTESSRQRLSKISIDCYAVLCDGARMLCGQGDIEPARTLLERILKSEPKHFEARVEHAMLETRVGLEALGKLAEGASGREAWHEQINRVVVVLKAVSHESRQFSLSSMNNAAERLAALDINLRARTSLVDVLLRTPWRRDALVEALVEADQLVRDFPTTASVWIARAAIASQVDAKSQGEFLKRAVDCEPSNVNLIGDYAGWLLTMGRNREALEQLESALAVEPKNAMIKWRLADFHVGVAKKLLGASGTDRLVKARIAIDRARALAPDHVRVLAVLGEWHEQQSEWTSAADAFAQAYEADRSDVDARGGHARALQREALGLLATPSGRGVDAAVRAKATARAYELLREAVRLAPQSDDLEFARRRLAAHDREERIEPLVQLARTARMRKDNASAIEFLVQAERVGPLVADELALLGQCRADAGDVTGAIDAFERLKKADPKSLQAANMLARLYSKAGNTSAARREAESFIELAKSVPDTEGFLAAEVKVMESILRAPESR